MEDNDSDDSETENEEIATAKQTHKRKKFKSPKLERFANSGTDDDDVANDASSEGDNEEDDDNTITDQPRKKKRKMSKLERDTDSEDDTESKDDEDDDNESEKEEEVTARKGFANVLSNILSKKTVSSKKVILAQGKTDREIMKLKESKLPQEDKDVKEPSLTAQELEEKKLMVFNLLFIQPVSSKNYGNI